MGNGTILLHSVKYIMCSLFYVFSFINSFNPQKKTQGDKSYYYPNLTDEKTEAQRNNCPRHIASK